MFMISRKSSTIRSHQFGAGGFTHCIHTQEALIEKVKQDISGQFNAINIKIKNHSHQKKHRNVSKERIEWKIQYQKLRKDENRIFNDINLTLSSQRDHLPYFECSLEENKDMTWCARKQISMMLQEKFEQSLSLESMKEEMMQVENDLDKELKEVKDDANECSAEIKRKYDSEEGDYSKSSVLVPAANNNFLDFDLLGELKHILETFILSGFSSILAEDINLLSDKFLVEEQQPDSLHEVMLDKMPFSASCRTSSTNLNKFNHQEGWKPFSSSSVYVLKRQHDLKHEEQKHPLNKEIAAGDECSSKVDEELCKKPSIKKSSKETKEQSFCIISKQVKGNSNAILQQKAQMSVLAIDHLLNKINKWINSEIRNEVHDRLEWLHKIHRITEERYVGHKIRCKVIEKDTKQMNTVKREQQMKSIKQKLDRYLTEKMEVMLQLRRKDEISNCLDTSTRIAQIANNSERVKLRQNLAHEKARIIEGKREETRREQIAKEKRLHKLAKSTPYYSSLKEITSNLEKPTASCLNAIYEPSDSCYRGDFQRGVMTGFTNEKLFSDPKFRLAYALHESKVASSAYSCAVVKHLIPREPERTTGIQPY